MDGFERRALELEVEQRHRFELGGSHREFWNGQYEQMQSFLVAWYRKMSKSYNFSGEINNADQRLNAS